MPVPPPLKVQGRPQFLLGVNYWSRAGGPLMWERFDEGVVRAELAQMRRIGLNTCRSFAFIPTFMPRPPALSTKAQERLKRFLDLCGDTGIWTIPTALVGHMSGENYGFPGQEGRCPYTDPEVRQWQQQMVRVVAGAGADHAAVIAYLASNEMPLWGGRSDADTVKDWAELLRRTLREHDADKPFSLGDGVMNLKGGDNGFNVQALRGVVDFVGPHTYYTDADPLRQALNAEFCLRSVSYLGLPVLFEEFGCSADQASDENQVLYYREVLHACLTSGASGALGWCFTDFDLVEDSPYRFQTFELGFGITRADGSEKPVCEELRTFSKLVEDIGYETMEPPEPHAAILVPRYFNHQYPFSWEDRDRMRRTLLQAYVLCAGAGLEAELVPEGTDLTPYPLVLAPSTQKLMSPTWEGLLQHARQGNTIYWSYFGGDYNFHQGPWAHLFTELTGCRHRLRYACYDLPEDETHISGAGLALSTHTGGGEPYPRAYLPLDPVEASVLARDSSGRPALVRKRHGAGQVFFLNHPWEYYLSQQANINEQDASYQLYDWLAQEAGVQRLVRCSEAAVQARVVNTPEAPLLWLINHAWRPMTTSVRSPGGVPIHGAAAPLDAGSCYVELQPKQVAVYRLVR